MSRRWWTLVAVSLATFMTYLDNNVTNVAIPTIQRSLHLSVSGLEWVVSSYLLVFAGLLLAGGRLADHYGRRRLFLLGLAIFTSASLAAGLAGNGAVLIASRAVQGLGAAAARADHAGDRHGHLQRPAGAHRGHRHLERDRRHGPGLRPADRRLHQPAPALGLDLLHQRAGRRDHLRHRGAAMRESRGERVPARPPGRLDVPGLAISALMLFALVYALIEGQDRGWTSPLILGAFAVAVASLAVFLFVESRAASRWSPCRCSGPGCSAAARSR